MTRASKAAWILSGATLLAHLAVAGRYDFFRDELYFIVCGRHPAFGYVDQPPLVPLLAAATQAFGAHLVLLRALPALAAAATVLLTCRLAALIGAGGFGAALAGLGAASAPMYMGVMTTLGTSTFEPLAWTSVAYLVGRAVVADERRCWIWAGAVAGVALECKYALPLYLLPLALALVATGRARALACRELAIGLALATALAAPSAIWQLTHGLPFVQMIHNQAQGKNVVLAPLPFLLNQLLVMNPLWAPLWLGGLVAPFVDARWRAWRFLALAFALCLALMIVLHAKDYYAAPAYGALFALGGAALEGWLTPRWARAGWIAAALALSALLAPLAMPILPPARLAAYIRALPFALTPQENERQSALPQLFADMLGWRRFVASVAAAYRTLTPDEQARVAILAHNYGEAAAIDFYGPAYGLPPALSEHNQYWQWGPRGHDGSILMRMNEEPAELDDDCQATRLLGRYGGPYVMPYEDDAPITLCRGLHPPLPELWPKIKRFY